VWWSNGPEEQKRKTQHKGLSRKGNTRLCLKTKFSGVGSPYKPGQNEKVPKQTFNQMRPGGPVQKRRARRGHTNSAQKRERGKYKLSEREGSRKKKPGPGGKGLEPLILKHK